MAIIEDEPVLFEVYYHPNEYTYTFKYAFKSLEEAEAAVNKEYIGYDVVKESDAKPPFISITNENYTKDIVIAVFYSKIYE